MEHDPAGDLGVIQMKDLEDNYTRIGADLTKVDSASIAKRHYLQPGDVLLLSKGSNNFAVLYDLKNQRHVAASAFFVLRPDSSRVLPAYLAWYLNQPPVQQYIKDQRAGTYIPNVNRGTIEGISVHLPGMQKQVLISRIASLSLREKQIIQMLQEKRSAMVDKILIESLNQ